MRKRGLSIVVVGVEVVGIAVVGTTEVFAAVVAEPVVVACGCEHGIEVGICALTGLDVHFGIEVSAGLRFGLVCGF